MACESDKCEKYGMHHDYKNGVEVRKRQFCERDDRLENSKQPGKTIDKDSAEYFMTKMTQEEFLERPKGNKTESFELNYIQPDFKKMRTENPCLYSKYEAAKKALELGEISFDKKGLV